MVALHPALSRVVNRGVEPLRFKPAFELDRIFCERHYPTHDDDQRIAQELASAPFDLEAEPPIRVYVVPRGENSWLITIVIHHIASDDQSFDPVVEDLQSFILGPATGVRPGGFLFGTPEKREESRVLAQLFARSSYRACISRPTKAKRPVVRWSRDQHTA